MNPFSAAANPVRPGCGGPENIRREIAAEKFSTVVRVGAVDPLGGMAHGGSSNSIPPLLNAKPVACGHHRHNFPTAMAASLYPSLGVCRCPGQRGGWGKISRPGNGVLAASIGPRIDLRAA